jgi:hypothetical protein
MTVGAQRARAIVTSLLADDTFGASEMLDDLNGDEAEEVIIQLSTDCSALLRRLAFLMGDEPLNIWQHVVLARINAEEYPQWP